MTRICLIGLAVVILLIPSSGANQTYLEDMEKGVKQFHAGYHSWDFEALLKATQTLKQACATEPDDYLPYHWLGITWFHVLVHSQRDESRTMEKGEFKRLSSNAREALEKATKLNNADSEAHALLATLAGMQINREPIHALWRGPAVLRHRELALRHGKDNPRTQYLVGAAFVQGPDSLGGVKKGLPYLHRAEKLFEAQVSPTQEPTASASTWGYEHCLILLGDVYQRLGNVSKAEEYFRKATTVNPHNKVAQRRLHSIQRSNDSNE